MRNSIDGSPSIDGVALDFDRFCGLSYEVDLVVVLKFLTRYKICKGVFVSVMACLDVKFGNIWIADLDVTRRVEIRMRSPVYRIVRKPASPMFEVMSRKARPLPQRPSYKQI